MERLVKFALNLDFALKLLNEHLVLVCLHFLVDFNVKLVQEFKR